MSEIADAKEDVWHSSHSTRHHNHATSAKERTTGSPVCTYPKTSLRGSKTLACPEWVRPQLTTKREHSWDEVKKFAKSIARHMAKTIPARFTDNLLKQARKGKVFLDYLRNSRGATTVAAYSVRAKPRAPLSVPLSWEKLTSALPSVRFAIHSINERLSIIRN